MDFYVRTEMEDYEKKKGDSGLYLACTGCIWSFPES
jgi:hypothetical protein